MHKYQILSQIKYSFLILINIGLILLINSCASSKTSISLDVKEIRPCIISGYLDFKELPNSLALIPPPPEEGSTAFTLDKDWFEVKGNEWRA